MKTTKFLISLLLLFAMCLSLMSSAALAEEVGAGDEGGDETIVEEGSGEGGEGSGESGEGSGESGEAPGEGEEEKKDEEKKDPEPASSVTPLSTINYYKGGSGMGGDKSFSLRRMPRLQNLYLRQIQTNTQCI